MPGLVGFTVTPDAAHAASTIAQDMLRRLRHCDEHDARLTHLGAACLGLSGGSTSLRNGWPGESDNPTATFGALDGAVSSFGKYAGSSLLRGATSDIDKILALYDGGEKAFYRELRGAFSFAIWDGDEKSLILGSDRHGQRFLYWTIMESRGEFAFSSELKGLLALPSFTPELDPQAPVERLFFGHLLGERTWLRQIKLLPPGSIVRWQGGSILPERHSTWDFSEQTLAESPEELADRLRSLLDLAVNEAIGASDRATVLLGGGFHSRQILAAASNPGKISLQALTAGVRETDEALVAEIAVQMAGAQWSFEEINPDGLWDAMERAAYLSDGETGVERAGFGLAAASLAAAGAPAVFIAGGARAVLGDDADQRLQARLRGPEYFQEFWMRLTQPLRTTQPQKCFQPDVAVEAPVEDFARVLQQAHAPCASRDAWQSYRFFRLFHWRRRLHGGVEHLLGRTSHVCNPYLSDPIAEFGFHLPGHLRSESRLARDALRRTNRRLALLRDAPFALLPEPDEASPGAGGLIGQWLRGPWRDKMESLITRNEEALATWFNMDYVHDAIVEHAETRADQSRLLLTLLHTLTVLRTLAQNRRYGLETSEKPALERRRPPTGE